MARGLVTVALTAVALAALALAAAPAARAGGPGMALGAAEVWVRAPDLVGAKTRLATLRLAGLGAVRITTIWAPGQAAPAESELAILRSVAQAGRLTGVQVYLSVFAAGSRTTPLTPEAQAEFAAFTAAVVTLVPELDRLVIGNEPNLNRFWLPQFNPDGTNAAAPAYLSLLARTYDAVKAARPTVVVFGGALAARGVDRPGTGRDTHSPTKFLRDLGAAYRASGRMLPVMDGLALHPYPGTSSQPPETVHDGSTTIGIADYPRLVRVLGEAFDGTAQPGSSLPVLYAEFGIETRIPQSKARSYTGQEPATTSPVEEATQASFYERAMRLAFCQPTVVGLFLFHTHDEPALAAWQSGLYYADGTVKTSFWHVRDATARVRGGSIARCEGLALDVRAKVRFPTRAETARGARVVRLTCELDCAFELRLVRAADGKAALARRGYARAGAPVVADLGRRALGAGEFRWSLTLTHPLNPAPVPALRESAPFRLP